MCVAKALWISWFTYPFSGYKCYDYLMIHRSCTLSCIHCNQCNILQRLNASRVSQIYFGVISTEIHFLLKSSTLHYYAISIPYQPYINSKRSLCGLWYELQTIKGSAFTPRATEALSASNKSWISYRIGIYRQLAGPCNIYWISRK